MKILIIYGGDLIYGSIANILFSELIKLNSVEVWNESTNISPFKILKFRIKKHGIFKGTSQFIARVFDYLFLRNIFKKNVENIKFTYNPKICGNLNNIETQKNIFENNYNLIICISTSILSEQTLSISKNGFINIHPGILPYYRGIGNFWAIHNKDVNNVGATAHWMSKSIDKGKIICKSFIKIDKKSLWEINYESMKSVSKELSKIINNGLFNHNDLGYQEEGNYYSWYGIIDYLVYLRNRI